MSRIRHIIVAGMHRSGTSALTSALSSSGIYLGDDDELSGKSWENPQGFFERIDIRAVSDEILLGSGADWWKVSGFDPENSNHASLLDARRRLRRIVDGLNASERSWVVKEPRMSLLLPVLRGNFTNPLILICCRHPVEVARSLRRRNGFPMRAGLALWEAYMVAVVRHAAPLQHELIHYQELLDEPETVLSRIKSALGEAGDVMDIAAGANAVRRDLRRETVEGGSHFELSKAQSALWDKLKSGKAFKTLPVLSEEAFTILKEFEANEAERLALLKEVQTARSSASELRQRLNKEMAKASSFRRETLELKDKLEGKEGAEGASRAEGKVEAEAAQAEAERRRIRSQTMETDLSFASGESSANDLFVADYIKRFESQAAFNRELHERLSQQRERYAAAAEQLDASRKVIESHQAELDALRAQVHDLEGAQGQLVKKRDELTDAVYLKDKELAELKSKHDDALQEVNALKAALQDLDVLANNLKVRLEASEQRAEAQAAEIGAAHSQLDVTRKELAAWQEQARESTIRAQTVEEQSEALWETIQSQAQADAEVQEALHASTHNLVETRKELGRMRKLRREGLDEIVRLKAKVVSAHQDMQKANAERKAFKNERNDAIRVSRAKEDAAKLEFTALTRRVRQAGDRLAAAVELQKSAKPRWPLDRRVAERRNFLLLTSLFRPDWYLRQNPDVTASGINPFDHYIKAGGRELRSPHPLFDARWYVQQLQQRDVKLQRTPLEHYLMRDGGHDVSPHPLFDPRHYEGQAPGVQESPFTLLEHYELVGSVAQLDPHAEFDAKFYAARYADVGRVGINPLEHYVRAGDKEGRKPNARFDPKAYWEQFPELKDPGITALQHWVLAVRQGRQSSK